jgi:hypothetical protein
LHKSEKPSPALPETEREHNFFPPHRGIEGGKFDFCKRSILEGEIPDFLKKSGI